MELLTIFTTGITGIVAAVLIVFLAVNALKAGNFGKLSKWVTSVDKVREGGKYGGRVLLVCFCFSILINIIQTFAQTFINPEPVNIALVVLNIIGTSLLASGSYEYIKTLAKNLPFGGA